MAGRIPQQFIDDLLNRADILDVVDSRVKLRKTGKNYSGLCPFHQEKSPSFTVEPEKQFYYCFGCGAGGNALGFLMEYDNLDFPQAVENLAGLVGMEVPREEARPAQQRQQARKKTLYDVLEAACRYYCQQLRQHPQKHRAVDYLKKRGLSGEIARDYALGYAPPGWDNLLRQLGTSGEQQALLVESGLLIENRERERQPLYDRFRDRIIYPIRDSRGRVIGFGGRVLGDDKPKYLNSPETPVFHKGEELYGLYELRKRMRKPERILIVEGYMDVIALAQHGISYAVATLGTATSASHLQRLFRLVPEVVFCFDGDSAGRQAAWRALEQTLPLMQDGRSARFLFLPEGEDPDSHIRQVGRSAFEQGLQDASQLTEFFFESLTERVDMRSLEGRARLGTLAMPLLRQLPDGFFRQLMLDQLARLTGLNSEHLQRLAPRETPSSPAPAPVAKRPGPPSPDSPPARRAPVRASRQALSPCRRALNLLLLQPALASDVSIDSLADMDESDLALLLEVLSLAQRFPQSTTPELLGRLYASPLGTQLLQLADREQITPAEGIEKEFRDIIQHLQARHHRRQQHASLLQQARTRLASRRTTD